MSWEEIDAYRRDYFAVMVEDDYSIKPDAIFASLDGARDWIEWQKSLWTEEEEEGIHPGAEIYVLCLRDLEGKAWNSYEPVPEEA